MLARTEFNEALARLTSAWGRGDLTSAFSEVEQILQQGTDEMKAQGLCFRGMIKHSQAELADAKEDWLQALPFAGEGTSLQYELQTNIAEVCEVTNPSGESLRWYRAALTTCSDGDQFSGTRALTAFVRLNGGTLPTGDLVMVASVAEKSWKVLQLPGSPDLDDLVGTVARLSEGFKIKKREIENET